jgi:hypothetical protein
VTFDKRKIEVKWSAEMLASVTRLCGVTNERTNALKNDFSLMPGIQIQGRQKVNSKN